MKNHGTIAVLGGGIIGLSAAHALARAGWKVRLFDPDGPASHASAKAGGILVRRAVVRSDEPGRMFYTRSIDLWPEWSRRVAEESGIGIPLWEGGDLCVFSHPGRAEAFARRLERESSPGQWHELVQMPSFLRDAVARRPWRIFHFPQEMCLDPGIALDSLREACLRSGVDLHYGASGPGLCRDGEGWCIEVGGGRSFADIALVAAGPWSGGILERLGWKAPLAAVRGQIALLPALYPGLSMLHLEDGCYAVPRHGRTLIGATSEVGQWDESTTPAGMEQLERRMSQLFPGLDLARAIRTWAGIRPRTRDRVPHLGWLEEGRLLVASGHYRSGISMAPLTAQVLVELVSGAPAVPEAADLDPRRPSAGYSRHSTT